MTSGTFDPFDPEVRAQHKRWLENWRQVEPILEAERWQRLAAMTPEQAQGVTASELLELWQQGMTGDNGVRTSNHAGNSIIRPEPPRPNS